MRLETLAIHAGHEVDPATGAVSPPICLSTTYQRAVDGTVDTGAIATPGPGNPNRAALETCLAALEGVPAPPPSPPARRRR